jgi:hypothetical protein
MLIDGVVHVIQEGMQPDMTDKYSEYVHGRDAIFDAMIDEMSVEVCDEIFYDSKSNRVCLMMSVLVEDAVNVTNIFLKHITSDQEMDEDMDEFESFVHELAQYVSDEDMEVIHVAVERQFPSVPGAIPWRMC